LCSPFLLVSVDLPNCNSGEGPTAAELVFHVDEGTSEPFQPFAMTGLL
jgi:hypothetical protein